MTPDDFTRYEAWLEAQDYSATSIYQALVDARSIATRCAAGVDVAGSLKYSARRMARWAASEGRDLAVELGPAFAELCDAARHKGGKRLREARSFEPGDWRKLRETLGERLEDHVLRLSLVTGLRIGDVLRIRTGHLREALETRTLEVEQKGGKRRRLVLRGAVLEAAEQLADAVSGEAPNAASIYSALQPGGTKSSRPYFRAYQRCKRRLETLGRELGLSGRMHTHRMRRTAAVQALRAGKDLDTVRQMLGQSSIAVTAKYTDEDRAEDVADAMDAFLDGMEE